MNGEHGRGSHAYMDTPSGSFDLFNASLQGGSVSFLKKTYLRGNVPSECASKHSLLVSEAWRYDIGTA